MTPGFCIKKKKKTKMNYQRIKNKIKQLQDEFCPEPLSEATSKQLIVRAVLEEVLEIVEEEENNSSNPGNDDDYIRKDTILDWAKKQAAIVEKLNGRGAMLKAYDSLIDKLKSQWADKKHYYVITKDGYSVSDYDDYEKAKTHADSIGGKVSTVNILPLAPQPDEKKGVKDAYDISAEYGRASEY
jgi:hypothetical protein